MDSLPQNNPSREISALWDFWDELQPCRSQLSLSSAGIFFQLQVEQGCCGRLSPCPSPNSASTGSPTGKIPSLDPKCPHGATRTEGQRPRTLVPPGSWEVLQGAGFWEIPMPRKDADLKHLSHGSRKILGFPGEILSFQGGFSRSERQNLEARKGKLQSRRSREEKLDAKPPSSLSGRQLGGRRVEMNFPKYREFNAKQNTRCRRT